MIRDDDPLTDEEFERVLRAARDATRPAAVSLMYLVGLLGAGISAWKAIAITTILLALIALPLGRRHLERLGLIGFMVVLVNWTGLLPIGRWASGAIVLVDRVLQP